MLSIAPTFDTNSKLPIYQQLYEWIRQQIVNEQLKGGEKMPSLRKLSQDLNISKNTIVSAYEQLQAEGYIESMPKIGYQVVDLHSLMYEPKEKIEYCVKEDEQIIYRYDLSGKGFDGSVFRENQWRKVTNEVLKEDFHDITCCGDPQGEWELRKEIAAYVFENRGVICHPEQIIIGAGTQYCVSLLCQMLLQDKPVVACENPGTNWIRFIFERFGFAVKSLPIQQTGYDVGALKASNVDVIFVTPSHQFLKGKTIPAVNRIALLNWACEKNGIIIEDDYDSEVRYLADAIPPLKSMDKNDRVVYLGSFSKIFIPSLRISFMILPQKLLERYHNEFYLYEQTASRLHQKAFARFIKEGYFESHIRRLKKQYRYKYTLICEAIETYWKDETEVIFAKGGVTFLVAINCDRKEEELIEQAKKAGIKIRSMSEHYARHMEYHQQGRPKIFLSFKAIAAEDIEPVIKLLAKLWFINK